MEQEDKKTEMIDRYLIGQLSLWELGDMEAKIKNDPAFSEEVNFQRDLMIGINETKRIELKKTLQNLEPAGILIRLQIDKNSIKTFAVAACILLFVSLGILYPQIRDASIAGSKKSFAAVK